MTDTIIPFDAHIYDSFCSLRSSIDAISCAAFLIPEGGDDERLGHLFRVLSERCENDLTALFASMKSQLRLLDEQQELLAAIKSNLHSSDDYNIK